MAIFPELIGKRKSYWNSNETGKKLSDHRMLHGTNEKTIEYGKRIYGADYLYGGWMEDRSFNLKGTYLEPSKFLHLGLDIFAPAGTLVAIDKDARLIQVYNDTPEEDGWGTRLLFCLSGQEEEIHLLYGHLSPNVLVKAHYPVPLLTPIGYLGTREENGGWSPHIHVQAIAGDITEFLENPSLLDGYGELGDIENLSKRFPDPLRFIDLG